MKNAEVTVTSVRYIDRSALEAELTVTDGTHSVICFSQPYDDTAAVDVLHVLCAENVVLVHDESSVTHCGGFSHIIVGTVCHGGIITVGGLRFDGVCLPGDVAVGDKVSFRAVRVDVW